MATMWTVCITIDVRLILENHSWTGAATGVGAASVSTSMVHVERTTQHRYGHGHGHSMDVGMGMGTAWTWAWAWAWAWICALASVCGQSVTAQQPTSARGRGITCPAHGQAWTCLGSWRCCSCSSSGQYSLRTSSTTSLDLSAGDFSMVQASACHSWLPVVLCGTGECLRYLAAPMCAPCFDIPFDILWIPFDIPRIPFDIPRIPFDIPRIPFGIPWIPFDIPWAPRIPPAVP
jgi:hypothetical protein